ncbi:MAG TPA: cold shock domain-containing protein [Terriglobales bacterium]|nr:cold shock domain-containing protein [Terriglobales bacterium]
MRRSGRAVYSNRNVHRSLYRQDATGIYETVEDPSLVGIGLKRGNRVATGTLKLWNADRGFGFIADDSGGPDIFLHISALQSAGIDPDEIRKGDRLTFDVESTRDGKTKARNVRQG